ncbi:MAG: hypothetical protein V7609_3528 [Verrucomicrobiota bacterium]
MGKRVARMGNWARLMARFGSVFVALFLGANCAGPIKSLYPPAAGEKAHSIYVINHGALHTGLAVKRSDISPGLWPANRDYARFKYIEVGWGDDDGYRKPLTAAIAVKALAGSRRTVLLADGFNSVRERVNTPRFTVIQVDLSDHGFARLCRHIKKTYALDETGRPIRLGKGWYRARGTYSAFHTCNTWAADGLRQAGCPITPAYCLMPGPLLSQVRRFGRVLRP